MTLTLTRPAPMALLLALLALLSACGDDPTPAPAAEGPTDQLHVDAAAAPEGNGSAARPFRDLDEALAVEGAAAILLAPGTYKAPSTHTFGTLQIVGVDGAEKTFLINRDAPDGVQWAITGALSIEGVTLFTALSLTGGRADLVDVAASGQGVGLSAVDMDAIRLERVRLSQSAGVRLEDIASATVVGLELQEAEAGLIALGVEALAVEGGSFKDVLGPAVGLTDTGATLEDVLIEGVRQVGEIGGDGVSVEGGALTMRGGAVRDAADRGVALRGDATASLEDVALSGGGRAMLFVTGEAEVSADRLTISDSRICVFVNERARLSLRESQVGPCPGNGLLLSDASSTEVLGGAVTGCPQGLIAYLGEGISGRVEGVLLEGASASSCLSAAGTSAPIVFKDNTVRDCDGSGIALLQTVGARIEGNTISDIKADAVFPDVAEGVNLVDSVAEVVGNRIFDVEKRGVSLIRSSGLIDGNTIGPVGDAGISLVDPGPEARTVITSNTIEEPVGVGIGVFSAAADITDNVISGVRLNAVDALGDGILFAVGADAILTGNTVEGCVHSGVIFTEAARGRIEGNTLRDNGLFGILEFCGGEPSEVEVGPNVFEGNNQGEASLCE